MISDTPQVQSQIASEQNSKNAEEERRMKSWQKFNGGDGSALAPSSTINEQNKNDSINNQSNPLNNGILGTDDNKKRIEMKQQAVVGHEEIQVHRPKAFSSSNDVTNKESSETKGQAKYEKGSIIASVRPIETCLAWITPAKYDTCIMPEALTENSIDVSQDDFNLVMEFLTNDYRFTTYIVCYRRIIVVWLLFGLISLIIILFSGMKGPILFALGLTCILINSVGIFLCLFFKKKMNDNLDKALTQANRILIKKNILLCVEDQGRISCHKILIHFVYYNLEPCTYKLSQILEKIETNKKKGILSDLKRDSSEAGQDSMKDTAQIISGPHKISNLRINEFYFSAQSKLLKHSQNYLKNLIKGRLTLPNPDFSTSKQARHIKNSYCLCQFTEDFHNLHCVKERWYNYW